MSSMALSVTATIRPMQKITTETIVAAVRKPGIKNKIMVFPLVARLR
jgi:hypothetical protein